MHGDHPIRPVVTARIQSPGVIVQLLCRGCDRMLGEAVADSAGNLAQIDGADTRGDIRYLHPTTRRRPHRSTTTRDDTTSDDTTSGDTTSGDTTSGDTTSGHTDCVRFYCDDRCGMRYAVPLAGLSALVRTVAARARTSTSLTVQSVRLPVRGRRNGRAPRLDRRRMFEPDLN
ncbi:MAG: hypothetical protein ABS81_08085 [Pseudonocardia sp. SCN 72-86]|nr:MAG: hypothetical protein ABS81_08085 [Pseudonocardia sp. SCN 72-86]